MKSVMRCMARLAVLGGLMIGLAACQPSIYKDSAWLNEFPNFATAPKAE